VTPEERAKAVVEHFSASLPPAVRPQLENVIARAITRAVRQESAKFQARLPPRHRQDTEQNYGQALIGKTAKIRDSALHGAGNAYPLPDGLKDGQSVTVLAFDHGFLTIRDEAGQEWRVYVTNIESR
jgi:hypothetical protein